VETLGLSARTLNCLKRSNINKVGEVLEKSREDLLQIRNFGEKSLTELYGKLKEMGLLPEGVELSLEETKEGERPGRGSSTRITSLVELKERLRLKEDEEEQEEEEDE
jgi:hypothetical protein